MPGKTVVGVGRQWPGLYPRVWLQMHVSILLPNVRVVRSWHVYNHVSHRFWHSVCRITTELQNRGAGGVSGGFRRCAPNACDVYLWNVQSCAAHAAFVAASKNVCVASCRNSLM